LTHSSVHPPMKVLQKQSRKSRVLLLAGAGRPRAAQLQQRGKVLQGRSALVLDLCPRAFWGGAGDKKEDRVDRMWRK
jgi:hypothetical protein